MKKTIKIVPAACPTPTTIEDFAKLALDQLVKTLVERGASYGSFFDNSAVAIGIQELVGSLNPSIREGLQDKMQCQSGKNYPVELAHLILNGQNLCASKLSRISQTPLHLDSWLDLAGYAILVHAGISMVEAGNDP